MVKVQEEKEQKEEKKTKELVSLKDLIAKRSDKELSLEELLEAGAHFGHQKDRWNPRMKKYIFTAREGVHIIDLVKTKAELVKAVEFMKTKKDQGEQILFVGTKKQAKSLIREAAEYAGMPYVIDRWLGGTLTNFGVIRKRIDKLLMVEEMQEKGELKKYTKKEQSNFREKIEKFEQRMGGIKEMRKLPGAVFVVDMVCDKLAVREARRMKIPVIALGDTNANPEMVDYLVPANDDAVGSLRLILAYIAYNLGK